MVILFSMPTFARNDSFKFLSPCVVVSGASCQSVCILKRVYD